MSLEINQSDLDNLRDLDDIPDTLEHAVDEFMSDIKTEWRANAAAIVGFGDYHSAIDNHRTGAREFVTDAASVNYSLVIERGRTDQNRQGEYILAESLHRVDVADILRDRVDDSFDKAFKRRRK